MARTKISEFSATPNDNTDIDGIDIAEGCAPSGINNAIRELMSQLKDFQTGSAGDPFNGAINGTVGATTPSTVVATQVDITAQGDLRLQDTTGGQYVALQAPSTLASSYTLTLPVDDGTAGQALITDGSGMLSWSSAASGDVYGPGSATDNAVARYDGTTGKIIQNSAVTIGDDGATVIAANSSSDGLRITQTGAGNALLVEDSANPDSSPTVITADGRLVVGYTSASTNVNSTTPISQIHSTVASAGWSSLTGFNWSNSTQGFGLNVSKSRSATIGTQTVVQSGDMIGGMQFFGDDGTNFIRAADILGYVDGTPGTNDMPGRLVFSTTADGASSPTERMRINNAGEVGIGGSSLTGYTLRLNKAVTGSTFAGSQIVDATIQSGVTGGGYSYISRSTTAAAAFTLSNLYHFYSNPQTFGAGSTVTSQYGFHAESSLTGATNNYGFYSNIASGTGRWNFYANGTADNYFAGSVAIGLTTGFTSSKLTSKGTDSTSSNYAFVAQNSSGANIILVRNDGLVTATGLSTTRTAVTAPAATDGNVFSGTYTPTLTNTTNVAASTASVCQYMRVGNVVTVSGQVQIDATSTGLIVLEMSLPVVSNFSASRNAGGTFSAYTSAAVKEQGCISAQATNDTFEFRAVVTEVSNLSYFFSATYLVI